MRVKGGAVTQRRHKKILKLVKGQWGTRSKLFRRGNEAMMKSYWYAYRDRRVRRREFRRLWITRINAAARGNGLSYSRLMHGLKIADVTIDRKALADIAVRDQQAFHALVGLAQEALDSGQKPKVKPAPAPRPRAVKAVPAEPVKAKEEKKAEAKAKPAAPKAKKVAEPKVEAVAESKPAAPKAAKKAAGKGDDLKKIEGIGPKIAKVLNEAGITTFAQLAETSVEELDRIVRQDAGITIAHPDTWPEQAALAAADQWDDLQAFQGTLKGGRKA